MYTYRCRILKVIDGDTVDAEVDLGFRVTIQMRFRLSGINAPEMNTEAGKAAKLYLERLLSPLVITVRTEKDKQEKFGRYLGEFLNPDGSVNQAMLDAGHAQRYI